LRHSSHPQLTQRSIVDSLLESLFQTASDGSTYVQVLLTALTSLFVIVAAILLAHRNDLGWWALIIGVFSGPVIIAMKYDLYDLIYAVPLMIIAFFGLWRFSRFKLKGKFTRQITSTPLTLTSMVGIVVGVILMVALKFNVFLFNGVYLSATNEVWFMYFAEALTFVSFIFIARGVRAGWLMLALGSIANVVVYFLMNPVLGMLGLQVFSALAAVYGFFLWGNLPSAEDEVVELSAEEIALQAATKATLDKLNAKDNS